MDKNTVLEVMNQWGQEVYRTGALLDSDSETLLDSFYSFGKGKGVELKALVKRFLRRHKKGFNTCVIFSPAGYQLVSYKPGQMILDFRGDQLKFHRN